MPQHLVVAHRTLGGTHLLDHLKGLASEDSSIQFHVVVPRYHPKDQVWASGTTQAFAQQHLDEMLETMADEGLDATGEVGSSNPIKAISEALDSKGADSFAGCVLSTLPRANSRWWHSDVPSGIEKTFPSLPLTHLVADDASAA